MPTSIREDIYTVVPGYTCDYVLSRNEILAAIDINCESSPFRNAEAYPKYAM